MSFFDDFFDPISFATIPGVTGSPTKLQKGHETDVQLDGIKFEFELDAQNTDFNGLFDQVGTKQDGLVDYDPTFSLSALAITSTGQQALFEAVKNKTIFDTLSITTFSEDSKGSLIKRFTHELEDARFYGYGTENGGEPRFGIAFDGITFSSTLYDDQGGKATDKSYTAQFDDDELAKANPNLGNTQVLQNQDIAGDTPTDLGHMIIGLFDGSDPGGDAKNPFLIQPTKFADVDDADLRFFVNEVTQGVTRNFDAGKASDDTPQATIQPLTFDISVANRGEVALLAEAIAEGTLGGGSRFWAFNNGAKLGDTPVQDLKADAGFVVGGVVFGGDDQLSLQGSYITTLETKTSAGDSKTPLQDTTFAQAQPGSPGTDSSVFGIAEGKDAFMTLSGIKGDAEFGKANAFNLIDFEVGFDVDYMLGAGNVPTVGALDFKPLVIEINPYTQGGGELLQRFMTKTAIPDAKISLVSEGNQSQVFEEMTFNGLSVLSYGMGMNANTRVELGYNDWEVTTRTLDSKGGAINASTADFGDLISANRVGSDGKLLSATQMDSVFQVGPGASAQGAENLDAFLNFASAEGLGEAQTKGFEKQMEVQDFAWAAYREDTKITVSDLGLTLNQAPEAHAHFAGNLVTGKHDEGMVLTVTSGTGEAISDKRLEMTAPFVLYSDLEDHGGAGLGLVAAWWDTESISRDIKFFENDKLGEVSEVAKATTPGLGQTRREEGANSADPEQPEDSRLFLHIDGIDGNADANFTNFDFGGWIEIEDYGLDLSTPVVFSTPGSSATASTLDVHVGPGDPALSELLLGLVDESVFPEAKLARVFEDGKGGITERLDYSFKTVLLTGMQEESDRDTALSFDFASFEFEVDRLNTATDRLETVSTATWSFAANKPEHLGGSLIGGAGTGESNLTFEGADPLGNLRYFLKFTDLETSTSPVSGFEDYVEIEGYDFSFDNLAGALGKSDIVLAPITVTGPIGGAIYDLLEKTSAGQGFPEMEIAVAREAGTSKLQEIQNIQLKNVYVDSLEQDSFNNVSIDLIFSNLKYQTSTTDAKTGKVTLNDYFIDFERDDYVVGSDGVDRFELGKGNDTAVAASGKGDDFYDGGDGIDTLIFTSAVSGATIDLAASKANAFSAESDTDTIINVENLILGTGADNASGDSKANRFEGGGGNDTLNGRDGHDTLIGGLGADSLDGGDGTDTVDYSASNAAVVMAVDGSISGGHATGDTLVSIENILGSAFFSDTLRGDNMANRLEGSGGADTLVGGGGDDTLLGGIGNDTLIGSGGADAMDGGEAGDFFIVGAGDIVTDSGTSGFDSAIVGGTAGAVVDISGWTGIERVTGSSGDDDLDATGSTQGWLLFGGQGGEDTLVGGTQRDVLFGGDLGDSLVGNGGNDALFGGEGDDTLLGGMGDDRLLGEGGADSMDGGGGSDRYIVGEGDILTDSGAANDGYDTAVVFSTTGITLDISSWTGIEQINGKSGNDSIDATGSAEGWLLFGGLGSDTLVGGTQRDVLFGGNEGDSLVGNGGNDAMFGGAGDDTYNGGAGDDVFFFSDDGDVVEDGGIGFDRVKVIDTSGLSLDVGSWLGLEQIEGFTGNDTLDATGSEDDLIFYGKGGTDTITGGNGDDTVYGGAGGDSLAGAAGNDALIGEGGNDTLNGGADNDFLMGGADADTFAFDNNFGRDVVRDYVDETDMISFQGHSGVNNIGDLSINEVGTNTIITLTAGGTDQITLVGINHNLESTDFLF